MIRRLGIPLVVLGTSLSLTALATWVIAASVEERDQARFANAVQSAGDRLGQRLELYITLLRSGVGFFAASDEVDAGEFQRFAAEIDLEERYPGVQGFGYTKRVPADRVDSLEAAIRGQGFPAFRVWPDTARAEYTSIVYLEPRDRRNQAALGFDMATEAVRREAMTRAMETGEPALSGPVRLVQEIDEDQVQAGFLIYAPDYGGLTPRTVEERRAALRGYIYAPFRADDLFVGIFGSEREPRVAFDIYDGQRVDPGSLLHSSVRLGITPSLLEQHVDTVSIEIAGRPWTIVFRPTRFFDLGSRRSFIGIFAFLGTLVSLTLFGLAYLEVRARGSAEESAHRSETLSRQLQDQAQALKRQVREVSQLNQRLEQANADLVRATELAEVTRREAEEARAQADQANRAKSQFLATMSHELRTPLNAIAGYVDLLELGIRGPVTDLQRRDLERIKRAQEHLLGLINDVLNFAKLEVGRVAFTIEQLPVDEVLNDLDALIAPLAAAKRIDYRRSRPEPSVMLGDRDKVLQILVNLLSNAIKFTEPGGRVRVDAGRQDGRVVIRVMDTGQGIPADRLRSIFEPFVQVSPDLTRQNQGAGLGLAIANELARGMRGKLTVQSEVGRGSAFTLWLPASDAAGSGESLHDDATASRA
jgi:signal transduction histidine kinase